MNIFFVRTKKVLHLVDSAPPFSWSSIDLLETAKPADPCDSLLCSDDCDISRDGEMALSVSKQISPQSGVLTLSVI